MDVDWDEWDEDFDPPKVEPKSDKNEPNSRQFPPDDEWDDDLDMDTLNTGRFCKIYFSSMQSL